MKLWDLRYYTKQNGKWVFQSTVIWNGPASLVWGEMKKLNSVKAYFEYYKVVENIKPK